MPEACLMALVVRMTLVVTLETLTPKRAWQKKARNGAGLRLRVVESLPGQN